MKLLPLLCLLLAGCAAPLGQLNRGAQFPYIIASDQEMASASKGFRAPSSNPAWLLMGWCTRDRILERHAGSMVWVPAHECLHACEKRGITMSQAIALMTPPGPINEHMAKRLASMQKVADRGGDWQALKDVYGSEAVSHPEILARLK